MAELSLFPIGGQVAKFDVREWALKGAEQRLVEIADEARAIFTAFPELRDDGRGFDSVRAQAPEAPGPRGRAISAAARKRISDAQKARWAKQRAGARKKK
jgi:hypothetical protein